VSLAVLYADNHLLALAKPAGVPTVPDASGDASLFDLARAYVEETYGKPGRAFLGIVHRLDRPVSGVVLFARTSKAASRLSAAFASRAVEKTYLGVGVGSVAGAAGTLEQWLEKNREENRVRVRAGPGPGAKLAVTVWRVRAREAGRVLFELAPATGRAHQLRVACATLGAPLAGDLKYGAPRALPDRSIALHAAALALVHPVRGERLVLEAPLPGDARGDAVQREIASLWALRTGNGESR
jgi:23S rRNA pseudouridine1911/1915/1917 synthase